MDGICKGAENNWQKLFKKQLALNIKKKREKYLTG